MNQPTISRRGASFYLSLIFLLGGTFITAANGQAPNLMGTWYASENNTSLTMEQLYVDTLIVTKVVPERVRIFDGYFLFHWEGEQGLEKGYYSLQTQRVVFDTMRTLSGKDKKITYNGKMIPEAGGGFRVEGNADAGNTTSLTDDDELGNVDAKWEFTLARNRQGKPNKARPPAAAQTPQPTARPANGLPFKVPFPANDPRPRAEKAVWYFDEENSQMWKYDRFNRSAASIHADTREQRSYQPGETITRFLYMPGGGAPEDFSIAAREPGQTRFQLYYSADAQNWQPLTNWVTGRPDNKFFSQTKLPVREGFYAVVINFVRETDSIQINAWAK